MTEPIKFVAKVTAGNSVHVSFLEAPVANRMTFDVPPDIEVEIGSEWLLIKQSPDRESAK